MLDKVQLIKEEIERLRDIDEETSHLNKESFNSGRWKALTQIKAFIDSLPEKVSNEDLEEEINRVDNWYPVELKYIQEIARHFVEWHREQMKEALQTEYEKGRFDMIEEMMKDAVDAKVDLDLDGNIKLDCEYEFHVGDKVKIIIIKTE